MTHAPARFVHEAQFGLPLPIPLLRGFAIPRHRFDVVLRHATTGGVLYAKVVLRRCVPGICTCSYRLDAVVYRSG